MYADEKLDVIDMSVETNPSPEIILTRTILSSPRLIYEAFTRAEGWCRWCCETATTEVFVGGKLYIYTEGYHAYGEFVELEPDRIIAFTWLGDNEPPTRIQVSLTPLEGQTKVTFKVSVLDFEQDWTSFVDFLERIWGRALDNLKNVLEQIIGN